MPNDDNYSSHANDAVSQGGTVQRGLQQVGDALHSTIDKVTQPVHGAVERASSTAHQGVDKVASSVHAAAEKVDEQTRRVRELPHVAADQARGYVRGRPLQIVGAAFALGWLLGRIGAYR